MLDLLLKLIDRCIDLARRQQEIDRTYYADFVVPAMSDFEVFHKHLLETLRQYKELLTATSKSLDEIGEQVHTDILFSTDLRVKLLALREMESDPHMGSLAGSVLMYLNSCIPYMPEPSDMSLPEPRNYGLGEPAEISESDPDHLPVLFTNRSFLSLVAAQISWSATNPRLSLLARIRWSRADTPLERKRIARHIDTIVANLQARYTAVVTQSTRVKKRLLIPK